MEKNNKNNREKFEELLEKACNVYQQKEDKKLKKIRYTNI